VRIFFPRGTCSVLHQKWSQGSVFVLSRKQLCEIGKQLQNLRVLSVSCNRLETDECSTDELETSFPKLEQLVIGDLDYDWSQVFFVASPLTNLLLLNCHENNISTIESFNSLV